MVREDRKKAIDLTFEEAKEKIDHHEKSWERMMNRDSCSLPNHECLNDTFEFISAYNDMVHQIPSMNGDELAYFMEKSDELIDYIDNWEKYNRN